MRKSGKKIVTSKNFLGENFLKSDIGKRATPSSLENAKSKRKEAKRIKYIYI